MELKPFVASHGLISIKLVSDALALIDSFLGYLVSENVIQTFCLKNI